MHKRDQKGIVSIVVSVIIMIILTLIAIAFAQIMRREQRQALDRQLSSQAYYAAETAINDAAFALTQSPSAISSSPNNCNIGSGALSQNVIDQDLDIEYSCVTLDTTPSELRYDSIKVDESVQVLLQPIDVNGNSRELKDIQIQWRDTDNDIFALNSSSTATLARLPVVDQWGSQPGILRLEIVPVANQVGNLTRDQLVARRKVFFLYPAGDGTTATSNVTWNSSQSGRIVRGSCPTLTETCSATIADVFDEPANTDATYYILRLTSIYDDVETTINGTLLTGGDAYFQGAQTEIDATGRANDVLRRISARVAVEQRSQLPQYVQQSFDGICKQLELINDTDVRYDCY